ncbi:MAG: hypothetical protein U5M51_07190 [Emticicia sp.]|nr:hypothetical protein [Emticicia sp.]
MSYSSFSLKEVRKRFNLSEERKILFANTTDQNPSDWLLQTLKYNEDAALISEKERSELLVSPILTELRQRNNKIFSVYSGANLDADTSVGLNGECDFILTKSPQLISVESPIFCLVEAKKDDILGALGQCVAQMLGARIYNQNDGNSIETIYGCVTTGIDWQLLKLENNVITIDIELYSIKNLSTLLGALQAVVDVYK